MAYNALMKTFKKIPMEKNTSTTNTMENVGGYSGTY